MEYQKDKLYVITGKNGNVDGSFKACVVKYEHEEAGRLFVRFQNNNGPWKRGRLYILRPDQWLLVEPSEFMLSLIGEIQGAD
jgi:hypothetical protein